MAMRASLRMVRISPSKARLVADLVRGRSLEEAFSILRFTQKKASGIIANVLKSAQANAEGVRGELYVATILVDEGPELKRFRPESRGRALRILKRSSKIFVQLAEREE